MVQAQGGWRGTSWSARNDASLQRAENERLAVGDRGIRTTHGSAKRDR